MEKLLLTQSKHKCIMEILSHTETYDEDKIKEIDKNYEFGSLILQRI